MAKIQKPKSMMKTERIEIKLTIFKKSLYMAEAHKRGNSISAFVRNAVHEYLYPRYIRGNKSSSIERIAQNIKNIKSPKFQSDFKSVVNELKVFDMDNLIKVPESIKKHTYNIMINNHNLNRIGGDK